MSILCRFVEWYLDYADKPDRLPAFAQKHAESCGHCRRQLSLSTEIRSMTKQVCMKIPAEPFGGFKPLAVRPSMVSAPSGIIISPGLWVGSLVAAVVLAVIGTDYSHRELFVQPMLTQKATSQQATVADLPQKPLFSVDELKAFMPMQPSVVAAHQQPRLKQRVAMKSPQERKSGLASVPVMPVRSRSVDRQLMASAQMLGVPRIGEQQDAIRTNRVSLNMSSATPSVAMMTKSVAADVQPPGVAELHAFSTGAGGGGSSMAPTRVSDVALSSTAMSAVPMESRGIPTESGLSL